MPVSTIFPNQIPFYLTETTQDPAEAVQTVRALYEQTGNRVILGFSNWDLDVRELWDIPEVQTWCQSFIRLGGLTFLAGPGDMPDPDMEKYTPPLLLVVACSGWPGAERLDANTFRYSLERIAELEAKYRQKG